ncbi:MAG: chemotaxis protein CheR [Candidatus Kuenenia sp.]|nr:chemotaxis protein CheR [Candidatus Kuenenia hertensis]
MNNHDGINFLQWCLPRLHYRWNGFRKVRRQVCRRIKQRIKELNLSGIHEYQKFLEESEEEWNILDSMCYISISRFYRDKKVFQVIESILFPFLANQSLVENRAEIRCWSVGCCSGEEPYTLQLIWKLSVFPLVKQHLSLNIIATERNRILLDRAHKGIYTFRSLKELPVKFLREGFIKVNDEYLLKDEFRENVELQCQDVRLNTPSGKFDLIMCRNLVLTYFEKELQKEILERIVDKLRPKGFLVIGAHEIFPKGIGGVTNYRNMKCIYQKSS